MDKKQIDKNEAVHLSKKLTPGDAKLNAHYKDLIIGSLDGDEVPMTGQIIRGGGTTLTTETGETGIFFEEPPEWSALRNWQNGVFSDAEKLSAKRWRERTKQFDLQKVQTTLKKKIGNFLRISNFEQLNVFFSNSRQVIHQSMEYDSLNIFLSYMGVAPKYVKEIRLRWEQTNPNSFKEFAPYAHYCSEVLSLFSVALTSGLITTRPTNMVDLEYLFYLPFCMVFCSGDKLHEDLSPLVLREDQSFVDRNTLKKDLQWLIQEWNSWTDNERSIRAHHFGSHPPRNPHSITYQLWNKFMKPWKPKSGNLRLSDEEQKRIMEELKPFMDAFRKHDSKRERT